MQHILSSPFTTTRIVHGDTLMFESTAPRVGDSDAVVTAMETWKAEDFKRAYKNKDFKSAWDALVAPGKVTLPQLRAFFIKYRLSYTCLNIAHEIVDRYKADDDGSSRMRKLGDSHFYFIQHNDTIYPLDRNRTSFLNKHFRTQSEGLLKPPSNSLRVPKAFVYTLCANNFDDLMNILRRPLLESGVPVEKDVVSIAYGGDLEALFVWLRTEKHVEAGTNVKNNRITGLNLYIHDPDLPQPDRLIIIHGGFENCGDPRAFNNAMNCFKRAMFHSTFRSEYSEDLITLFTQGRKAQLWCLLDSNAPERSVGLDRRSAYPAAALKMTSIPVFQRTDCFEAYGGEPIEDYSIYLVRNHDFSVPRCLMADRPLCGITGWVLNRIGDIKFEIVAVCKPSHLAKNPWHDLVWALFQSDLCDDAKKSVMNFVIGQMGKMKEERTRGFFTTSEDEAKRLGEDIARSGLGGFIARRKSPPVTLVDGFYPFQFFVYDICRWEMAMLAQELQQSGSKVFAICTDKIYCDVIPPSIVTMPADAKRTFASIGGLKAEAEDLIPRKAMEIRPPVDIAVKPPSTFSEVPSFIAGVNTFIEGSAGTRKTTASFAGLNPATTLCVCPNNFQREEKGLRFFCDAVTTHAFLGLKVAGDGANESNGKPWDLSKYTHCVFEELPQNSIPLIIAIMKRMSENPGITWIANGDLFQNNSAECLNNIEDRDAYIMKILPRAFPHIVRLTVNYRLTCEEHPAPSDNPGWRCECPKLLAERARELGIREALKAGEDVLAVIDRFGLQTFTDVSLLKALQVKKAVTQNNLTAHALNQFLHPEADSVGMLVIAKPHQSTKFLIKNKEYRVEGITADKYVVDGKPFDKRLFRKPAGRTCHSIQGETIADPYAVFDIVDKHGNLSWVVNRRWFYTTVSRAERFNRLWIYLGTPLVSSKDAKEKIRQYAEDDAAKGRPGGLTVAQMFLRLQKDNFVCHICHQKVEVVYEDGDRRAYSMDRINNDLGHTFANVRTAHLGCNAGQGTAAKIRDIEQESDAEVE